ncbi:2-methylcitrate dehydratase PrpD [Paraburkholderia unamae]|uniref:MmgE/PrpD family protein n=1 Tax=Paraburkholderia unamae TaxID=219649 RepID=UPI001CB5D1BC|nr:MmgE/PrpD family protein [Paraburkholderia unamae]CAG9272958.1 2-methylcitrate dehydratase PrpD [Paraburkholderia unamae]
MTLLHEFAAFAAAEPNRTGDSDVMHHAKRAVLDWVASLYPGTRRPPTTLLAKSCQDELGMGRSSVLGFGTTAFPPTAAWINGSAAHTVEFDDIYREAVYHPGSPTIAAALAVAQATNASGRAFLKAIVAGYEISTRVGEALQPSHAQYFHATGTIGCLGAAAAAAVLVARGDPDTIAHALATAATFASGLQQALRSDAMTKPLHAGHAAAVGVRAALAASCGVTGALDILEGSVGLGAAMADAPLWAQTTHELGATYHIARITHKVHACCGHVFPAIDATLSLRSTCGTAFSAVEQILVETYQAAIDATGRFDPRNSYEAKFGLPFAVSHALIHGSVGLDAFEKERVNDKSVRLLMTRCTLQPDALMSAGFPHRRCARVTVITVDGDQFCESVTHRRGDPESPLSDDDLNRKFDALCTPVIGHTQATKLRDQIWQLDGIDVAEVAFS